MENVKRERLAYDSNKESSAAVDLDLDRINQLPREVLGLIFSFLSLKEAAANSLVCPRWRYLWTLTPNLDFDGSDSVIGKVEKTKLCYREAALIEKRQNFVTWVDGVIASHRNSNLQSFRVVSDLGSAQAETIDKWLRYALTNKVQSLDLSFFDAIGDRTCGNHHLCYDFPHRRVGGDFKHLKQLTLHTVNVTGKGVEHLVRRCPLLEHVSVTFSKVLSSLEIIGPTSPSFKCLELNLCHALKSVVVRDSDIVTIKYSGMVRIRFVLINVPLLTQLWVGGVVTRCMDDVVGLMFGCVFSQLHTLNVHFYCGMWYAKKETKFGFKMPNLKQLLVSFPEPYNDKDSLLPIIKLISAAPYLERFVLELPTNYVDHFYDAPAHAAEATVTTTPKTSHFHLKEVELDGYRGVSTQLELITHLVDYAVALQYIIVDPCTFNFTNRPVWHRIALHEFDDEIFVRTHAKDQLKHIVPKKIGLKIL